MRFYPSHVNVSDQFRAICGQHTGIAESSLLLTARQANSANMEVCSANMPNYQKLFINENVSINHHLSGYGIYLEEAYIRVLGEAIERYALLFAPVILGSRLVYRSYKQIQEVGPSMKWEHMQIYSPEDYERMKGILRLVDLTEDAPIAWLPCTRLFQPDEQIFMPAQLLFTGYAPSERERDVLFVTGLSKGTACHTDRETALLSAMMESVEAHCFMIHWYTDYKSREIIIDDLRFQSMLQDILGASGMEATFYEYSLPDMPGHTVTTVLKNSRKDRPLIVVGCQSGLNPYKVIYRSLLEALAIYYLARNGPLMIPQDYLLRASDADNFSNLDANVAFYAFTDHADEKLAIFTDKASGHVPLSALQDYSGSTASEFKYVWGTLRERSTDAVVLDITPPEVAQKGYTVMRTFFPELVQLCLPSFPFTKHPAILQYGGITNEYPHPVP
ncbi:MAG: YcaO-like family protein [Propionibacteriaceae bacterium]|nr:YcaO-like family protein [Propionibacteriaceae bacterium]